MIVLFLIRLQTTPPSPLLGAGERAGRGGAPVRLTARAAWSAGLVCRDAVEMLVTANEQFPAGKRD